MKAVFGLFTINADPDPARNLHTDGDHVDQDFDPYVHLVN